METHMDEPCDICGDIGVLDAIVMCSKCNINREHLYCRKTFGNGLPNSEFWLCEECEMESMVSPKSVQERSLMLNPSGKVDQEKTCSAGCSKLAKWEKVVNSGKVKYLPAQEAIILFSGAKKLRSPSKSNMHSGSGPSKVVGSMSLMTPIKPKAKSPNSSSLKINANPSFRTSGILSSRHGNTQANSVVQQRVIQTSKDPKVILRKKQVYPPKLVDTIDGSLIEHAPAKRAAHAPRERCLHNVSSPAQHFPPIISSVNGGEHLLGGNDCTNVESRNFDPEHDHLMDILPEAEKGFQGPALDSSWKGSFKILDTVLYKELNGMFRAHPSSKVHRKVYEFSKTMPEVLQFKLLPRSNVWPDIFEDDCPDKYDIGLYFFSSNIQRSENYTSLLKFIEIQDLAMKSYMDGVELLVFTSKLLSAKSQRWNKEYFLWGIFHQVKKHKAVCKLYEELPLLVQPSYCALDNDASGDDDVELPLLVQPSDCAEDNYANGDDPVGDMEIDMLAGKDVGRVDIVISRESTTRIWGSPRDENAAMIFLQGSDTKKIHDVPRNLSFASQQHFLEVKKELDFPPGFEEMHRLRIQSGARTEIVRLEKSHPLEVRAISHVKKSDCLERVAEVSGANGLQPKLTKFSESPRLGGKHVSNSRRNG